MNINLGKLTITIGANTKEAEAGIQQTGEELDGLTEKASKSGAEWGKWAAAAGAAAAVAAAAIVKSSLTAINELNNLASATGLSIGEFERQAFAARQAGIEQDKYADIIKDVNEKIGEFLMTGGGPMQDFFDKIGPKVGVTAEQFKKLSGPQAMQLYVSSLEKAGVSQKEMTYYMEALAGDSGKLLPLLRNNGEAMGEAAKRAEELGIGLSEIDAQKAVEAQRALSEIATVIDSEVKKATVELAPYITAMAQEFSKFVAQSGGISSFVVPAIETAAKVVGVFADGWHGLKIILKAVEVVARGFIYGFVAGLDLLMKGVSQLGNLIIDSLALPFQKVLEMMAPFSEQAEAALASFNGFIDSIKGNGIPALTEFANAQYEAMATAGDELAAMLMEPIPSSQIEAFIDRVKEKAQEAAPVIAAALTGDTGGIGTGKPPEEEEKEKKPEKTEADRIREQMQDMYDAMIEEGLLREETLTERFARENELLRQGLEQKYLTEQEYALLSKQLAEDEAAAKADIVMSGMDAMVEAISIGGKKASKLQKALAITNAVIHGKEAAVSAWNAGMSVGGPWAPLVAAAYTAASIARTASMISSIKSGGSSMSGMSGGGGGGAAAAAAASGGAGGGAGGQSAQSPRVVEIRMVGEGLLSTQQVRGLMGQIGEQLGDGVKLVPTGG